MKLFSYGNDSDTLFFWCPGCKEAHSFRIWKPSTDTGPVWGFNGNMEHPTFHPSLLYPSKTPRCHLYLKNGQLEFLTDCGHELRGQVVPLPDWPGDQAASRAASASVSARCFRIEREGARQHVFSPSRNTPPQFSHK